MGLGTFEPHPVTLRFQSATAESTFNLEYRKNAVRYFRSVGIYLLAIMVALSITGLFVEFTVNRETCPEAALVRLHPSDGGGGDYPLG